MNFWATIVRFLPRVTTHTHDDEHPSCPSNVNIHAHSSQPLFSAKAKLKFVVVVGVKLDLVQIMTILSNGGTDNKQRECALLFLPFSSPVVVLETKVLITNDTKV